MDTIRFKISISTIKEEEYLRDRLAIAKRSHIKASWGIRRDLMHQAGFNQVLHPTKLVLIISTLMTKTTCRTNGMGEWRVSLDTRGPIPEMRAILLLCSLATSIQVHNSGNHLVLIMKARETQPIKMSVLWQKAFLTIKAAIQLPNSKAWAEETINRVRLTIKLMIFMEEWTLKANKSIQPPSFKEIKVWEMQCSPLLNHFSNS